MPKKELTCRFCKYKWTPRKDKVKACPSCKRYHFTAPKQEKNERTKN